MISRVVEIAAAVDRARGRADADRCQREEAAGSHPEHGGRVDSGQHLTGVGDPLARQPDDADEDDEHAHPTEETRNLMDQHRRSNGNEDDFALGIDRADGKVAEAERLQQAQGAEDLAHAGADDDGNEAPGDDRRRLPLGRGDGQRPEGERERVQIAHRPGLGHAQHRSKTMLLRRAKDLEHRGCQRDHDPHRRASTSHHVRHQSHKMKP